MEPKILSSLIITLCILKITSQNELTTSTPREVRGYCRLQKVTKGIAVDLINHYTNETTCTKLCLNNEACTGVSWRRNSGSDVGECRLKLFATGNNVEYWSRVNSDDTSLSYCWKLKTNVHHPGAIGQTNVTNETECQRRCIDNCNCTGVDWNEVPYNRTKCWMLLSHATRTPKNYSRKINHWTIVRTVPRNCYVRGICRLQKVTKGIAVHLINNYTNETTCTKLCLNNEACTGLSWRQNSGSDVGECRLELFATGNNVEYWSLVNSDDTSLSYCWKLKTNVHHPGAIGQTNVTNETECQRRCIANCNCTGVDWNEVPYNRIKCWMLLSHATRTPKHYTRKINHWTIVRTVPRNCYVRGNCRLQKVTKGIAVDLINNCTNETTCTELCLNNETCTGISLRRNSGSDVGECRLELFATGNNVEYWSLVNSDDTCNGSNIPNVEDFMAENSAMEAPNVHPLNKVCPDELDKEYSIHWSRTKAGTESYAPCPRNNSGTCSRNCSLVHWNPLWSAPNCNGCFDKEFKDLLEKVNKVNLTAFKNQTVIAKIASQLSTVTNKSEGLSPGNLNASVMMIKQLADLRTDSTINANAMEIKSIVQAANNVLQPNNSKSWQELEHVNQNIATSILFSLDVYGRSLAALNTSDHSIEVQDSLVLEAWSFEKSNLREIEFPNRSLWDENRGDGISISVEAFKNSMSSESPSALHMWGSYYRTVNDYLPGNEGGTDDVNSRVLSFSIDGLKTNERLERPVLITLRHNQEKRTSFQRTCAFWNFSGGNWDSVGCSVTSTNLTHTICSCDHLTNFAILMSLKPKEDWLLSLISIIGCSISVAALILTIFVYALTWKQAKSAQATVLLNLCVALIIAYIIFMVGADKVISKGFSKIGCQTVAVLLHYFFLAAFFIMLAEGVELLLYIIFVFHVRRTRETVMLVISAWVLPLIIVGVSLGSTKLEGYGHEKACWLSSENHLIWAFVGPVLGIVAANFIILIIVLRWRSQKKALLSKNVKKRDEINATIWNLAVTCPVLGLGWLFGFLTLAFDHTVFHYMFVAVNSLQGLLIFIFHALFHNKRVNERISSLFSTYICSRCRNSDQAVITQSTSSSQDQPTKKADKKGRAPRGGMGKQGNVRGHGTQLTSFGDSETMESTQ